MVTDVAVAESTAAETAPNTESSLSVPEMVVVPATPVHDVTEEDTVCFCALSIGCLFLFVSQSCVAHADIHTDADTDINTHTYTQVRRESSQYTLASSVDMARKAHTHTPTRTRTH